MPEPRDPASAPPTTSRVVLLQLWRAVVRHRDRLAIAVVLLVLAKLATVGVPLVLKRIIEALGRPEAVIDIPVFLLLAYALLRFAGTLFGELRDRVFAPAALRTVARFSRDAFLRLLLLDPRQLPGRQTGALTRDVERGTAGIAFLLGVGFFTVVPTLVEIACVLGVMVHGYSNWYTAVLVATFLLYTVYTVEFTHRREIHQRALNELDSRASSYLVDRMFNYDTVKSHAREELEGERFRGIMEDMVATGVRNQTALSILHVGQSGIIAIGVAAVMVMAGRDVVEGRMTVGDLVLINAYVIQVCLPLNALGFVFRQVRDAMVNVERLFGLLQIEPALADTPGAPALVLEEAEVRFRHVDFGYEPGRRDLADIDFVIEPGATVAVVGASGSGKSTLARLLLRLYDAQGGSIEIDGRDVRSVTQKSLRAAIGVVPQDAGLFSESIAYNIRYGRPEASLDEVKEAARQARIHELVESLPQGYDTVIGERGLKLSGGEKQRIAIARALIKDPPILILDEATSALDPIAERAIQASLEQASRDRTTLVIAHRMSTITGAALILVLERGRIVERGTHDELLGAGGLYARMWALQQQQNELEREERRLAMQPVNLATVAATVIDALRPEIDERGLHLYTAVEPQSGRVTADPGVLQAVASRLLSHVVHQARAGTRVEVQVQRVRSRARLRLSSGAAWQDGAFTTELLRLRRMVEEQGGRIISGKEGGAYHVLSFPVRAVTGSVEGAPALVPAADPERRARIQRMLARSRIAIVEDSSDARELLGSLLRQLGAAVRSFSTGREASAWFAQNTPAQWPHVLVCDIGLPDEDGYSIVRAIRDREAKLDVPLARRMPAIALTGMARAEDRTQALLAGFQLHLTKPVDPGELLAAIAGLLEDGFPGEAPPPANGASPPA